MNKAQLPTLVDGHSRNRLPYLTTIVSIIGPAAAVALDLFAHFHIPGISYSKVLAELLLVIVGVISGVAALRIGKRRNISAKLVKVAILAIITNAIYALFICAILGLTVFIRQNHPRNTTVRLEKAMKKLARASSKDERFRVLDDAAKESFAAGNLSDARRYAEELLALAPNYVDDWNYGNAIHDGNVVLGRIALRAGDIQDAKYHLIEAGKSPGSPTLNSFGPDMTLAKELLKKGERETVLKYFQLCGNFWKDDFGALDKWRREVEAGKIPNFGPNLVW